MLPEAEAAEALQMPTLPERTRHGDGEGAGPSFSGVCPLVALPALPGTPSSLCSFSHTQGAGHRLGRGCWHGAGCPGSRDSIQPVLPWGGGMEEAYRPKAVLEIFRLGLQRKREGRHGH